MMLRSAVAAFVLAPVLAAAEPFRFPRATPESQGRNREESLSSTAYIWPDSRMRDHICTAGIRSLPPRDHSS